MTKRKLIILDGGLATQLEHRGHDLRDRLWSARLLRDAPAEIQAVHREFLEAGADCITTASYQATIDGFMNAGLTRGAAGDLLTTSVTLAKAARDNFWMDRENRVGRMRPLVAASIGPYGAYLANGAEYDGQYGLSQSQLVGFHRERWKRLADAEPDLMLCETTPSLAEARAYCQLAAESTHLPTWISFSCRDGVRISEGTPIGLCAEFLDGQSAIQAIGVNCTSPDFFDELIPAIRNASAKPIIAYPNSGEQYCVQTKSWFGSCDSDDLAERAVTWHKLGASIIGGCCRMGPSYIHAVRRKLYNLTADRK